MSGLIFLLRLMAQFIDIGIDTLCHPFEIYDANIFPTRTRYFQPITFNFDFINHIFGCWNFVIFLLVLLLLLLPKSCLQTIMRVPFSYINLIVHHSVSSRILYESNNQKIDSIGSISFGYELVYGLDIK